MFESFNQATFSFILTINGVEKPVKTNSVQAEFFGHHLAVTFAQDSNSWFISRSHLESELVYFFAENNRLILSNDITQMRSLADAHQINKKWLLYFFSFTDNYTDESPFQGISILPALSQMSVNHNGYEITRQSLLTNQSIRKKAGNWSTKEWIKQWQLCKKKAVENSSQQSQSIAIMLSSGLDSGSIAAYLNDQLKANDQPQRIKGFSWRFPNNATADESKHIQELVEHLGIDHEFIDIEDADCFSDITTWPTSLETPHFNAMRRIKQTLYQTVKEQGFDVLLNGHIGDELCFVDRYVLAELWRDNKPAWLKEFFNTLMQTGWSIRDDSSFRYCVKQWLNKPERDFSAPPSFSENAATLFQRYGIGKRLDKALGKASAVGLRAEQVGLLTANSELAAIASERAFTNRHAINRYHPYLNQELIALALVCPAYLLSTHKQTKWISRQALSGLLPDRFINRSRIGQLDELFAQGLEINADAIKDYLFRSERRWPEFIQEDIVSKVLDQQDWDKAPSIIVPCLGFERWLDEWRSTGMPIQ